MRNTEMNGKTHILGGLTLGVLGATFTKSLPGASVNEIIPFALFLGSCTTGAILPDIDKRKTKISSKHPIISFFIRIFTTHRGITHSPFLYIIITGSLASSYFIDKNIWSYYIFAGISLGYASHLFLDMLNPKGIPLFYPICNKRFNLLNITTGGIIERILYVSFIFIDYLLVKNMVLAMI